MKPRSILSAFCIALGLAPFVVAEEPAPLPNAHAHNDYLHERPLLDALDHGFCSVEVDVWLEDGELLVGHYKTDLVPSRTLEALYLEPLRERVRANGGRVYSGGPELILLIDIKSRPTETYEALRDTLKDYADMLTTFGKKGETPGAVRVVLSGGRPKKTMLAQKKRYAGYDGRIPELDENLSSAFMPLVSASWTRRYPEAGTAPLPEAVRDDIEALTQTAHARGYKLRFWDTPDDEALWAELLELGVDFINTDDLSRLRDFLLKPVEDGAFRGTDAAAGQGHRPSPSLSAVSCGRVVLRRDRVN